ncbi:MAG: MFS transporter, partial [Cellulomonadaceae bacterium]|nr:MFS transporter [Cellulomonadaceae bacterium]
VYVRALTPIFFALSVLWQAGLGKAPLASGLVSVPFALGSILGSSQTARLAVKMGRRVLTIGTAMVAVGLVAVWVILWTVPGTHINHWMLLAPLFIAGTGSGLFIAPNQQFIIATVDRSEAGAASGVIGTAQRVGAASGIAIVGSVLFGTLHAGGGAGTTAAQMAAAYERSTAYAIAVSAVLAVTAFLLVFTLPKRTGINP